MKNKTKDLSVQEKQNDEGQMNPNLLFDDAILNRWYRGKEVHVSPHRYYVVFKGHQPGIYDNWPDTQKQIVGFNGCKQKAFDNLTDAVKALKEWLQKELEKAKEKFPIQEIGDQNLAEVKNEWHNRIKSLVLKTYTEKGNFPATVFFLAKEGNRTKEYSMAYPLYADNDNDLVNIMIREECGKHDVISSCCVIEDYSLETNEMGKLFLPDKMNSFRMICESRYEMVHSVIKFKDGKITFETEERDHTHSNEKSGGRLCSLFYSTNESLVTQG